MIKSMTGYGRAEEIIEGKKITVEIRSLNHRYCEISLKTSKRLFPLESQIKKFLLNRIARGRLEVSIKTDTTDDLAERLELDLPLAREYYALLSSLKNDLKLEDDINLSSLGNLKDIITSKKPEEDPELWENLEIPLALALDSLEEMRIVEGKALKDDILMRINNIRVLLKSIKDRSPRVTSEYRDRLAQKIKEISESLSLDETRLVQEVAFLAEKSDITEEITRTASHINQFETLLGKSGSIGRKLDFLLQEINREINTIGSKAGDAEISQKVVDAKSELEKIREQIQNIE